MKAAGLPCCLSPASLTQVYSFLLFMEVPLVIMANSHWETCGPILPRPCASRTHALSAKGLTYWHGSCDNGAWIRTASRISWQLQARANHSLSPNRAGSSKSCCSGEEFRRGLEPARGMWRVSWGRYLWQWCLCTFLWIHLDLCQSKSWSDLGRCIRDKAEVEEVSKKNKKNTYLPIMPSLLGPQPVHSMQQRLHQCCSTLWTGLG